MLERDFFVKFGSILQCMYKQWRTINGLRGESSSEVCLGTGQPSTLNEGGRKGDDGNTRWLERKDTTDNLFRGLSSRGVQIG